LDALTVFGVFLLAFYLRFRRQFLAIKYADASDVDPYVNGALILAAVWVFLIWQGGGYKTDMRGSVPLRRRLECIGVAGVKALIVLMVVSYMYRGLLLSRQVYLMSGVLAFGAMALVRVFVREMEKDLAGQHIVLDRIVVVGTDRQTEEFIRRVRESATTTSVVGVLTSGKTDPIGAVEGRPVLGALDDLEAVHRRTPFEQLVLSHAAIAGCEGDENTQRLIEIVNFCEARGILLYSLPNVLSVAVSQNELASFSGLPLVLLRDASAHPGYAVVKRAMDIVLSLLVLALGSPFWLFIAAAVKWTSKGPILFSQVRLGLHGRPFRIFKFRSMVADAEARLKDVVDLDNLEVPGFKIKGDPRVTPIGRFLRRTSLDEIPQLLNVLMGEMSLVGPRPEMPALVSRYTPWQRRRLKAKPGITGLQQIMARGQPLAGVMEYDLVYLKHQSLLLDLYILLKTVMVVIKGDGITH